MARRRSFEVQLDFSDTFVLLWDSRYVNYDFVNHINQIFSLRLTWLPEMKYYTDEGEEVLCPRYEYYDEVLKLLYVVIDNPVDKNPIDPSLKYYDKILFVVGRDAREVGQQMHDAVLNGITVLNPYDLLMGKRAVDVAAFRDGGVVQVDYLGFAGQEECSLTVGLRGTIPPKLKKHVQELSKCIQNLFQTLSDTMELEELD